MAYTPPAGNHVDFTTVTGYVVPAGNQVDFTFRCRDPQIGESSLVLGWTQQGNIPEEFQFQWAWQQGDSKGQIFTTSTYWLQRTSIPGYGSLHFSWLRNDSLVIKSSFHWNQADSLGKTTGVFIAWEQFTGAGNAAPPLTFTWNQSGVIREATSLLFEWDRLTAVTEKNSIYVAWTQHTSLGDQSKHSFFWEQRSSLMSKMVLTYRWYQAKRESVFLWTTSEYSGLLPLEYPCFNAALLSFTRESRNTTRVEMYTESSYHATELVELLTTSISDALAYTRVESQVICESSSLVGLLRESLSSTTQLVECYSVSVNEAMAYTLVESRLIAESSSRLVSLVSSENATTNLVELLTESTSNAMAYATVASQAISESNSRLMSVILSENATTTLVELLTESTSNAMAYKLIEMQMVVELNARLGCNTWSENTTTHLVELLTESVSNAMSYARVETRVICESHALLVVMMLSENMTTTLVELLTASESNAMAYAQVESQVISESGSRLASVILSENTTTTLVGLLTKSESNAMMYARVESWVINESNARLAITALSENNTTNLVELLTESESNAMVYARVESQAICESSSRLASVISSENATTAFLNSLTLSESDAKEFITVTSSFIAEHHSYVGHYTIIEGKTTDFVEKRTVATNSVIERIGFYVESTSDSKPLNTVAIYTACFNHTMPVNVVKISNEFYAVHQGIRYEIADLVVRDSLDSVGYSGSIEVLEQSAFSAIHVNDEVTVYMDGMPFQFLVDKKSLDRSSIVDIRMVIELVSPTMRYDAPRASAFSESFTTMQASELALLMIPDITWDCVDWLIPSEALAFEKTTPLEVVKKLAESIGAMLYTNHEGLVFVKPKIPVATSQFEQSVELVMTDDENNLSYNESYSHQDLVNEVTLGRDNDIEWNMESKVYEKQRRAMLYLRSSPWRENVSILHTSLPTINIQSHGTEILDKIDDVVEFKEFKGSVEDPIYELKQIEWLYKDLGQVTFLSDSNELNADQASDEYGYSVAKVAYSTRRMVFEATGIPTGTVQFLALFED